MLLGTLGAHGARKRHVEAILVTATSTLRVIQEAQVPLDRDIFLRSLLRELAGTLEDG
jgi:hypothetical protein